VTITRSGTEIATPGAGVRCVDFVRRGSSAMFASLHRPYGNPSEGVVICSSINADHSKLYGAEVRLAAELAGHGLAVVRFHYRGQGHSTGDASDITFGSLQDDCLAAAEFLRDQTDVSTVSFVGSRVGALVASAAAARQANSRLVLWEPIVDPARYVREAERSMAMSRMGDAGTRVGLGDAAGANGDGSVDVHGYRIHKRLISSLEERTLTLGVDPRELLLVQISRRQELSASYAALIETWRHEGRSADAYCVRGEIAWWIRGVRQGREETESIAAEAIATTVEWLAPSLDISKGVG
jgi:pimeloyl-ACP methyl ester carboxylesterase